MWRNPFFRWANSLTKTEYCLDSVVIPDWEYNSVGRMFVSHVQIPDLILSLAQTRHGGARLRSQNCWCSEDQKFKSSLSYTELIRCQPGPQTWTSSHKEKGYEKLHLHIYKLYSSSISFKYNSRKFSYQRLCPYLLDNNDFSKEKSSQSCSCGICL